MEKVLIMRACETELALPIAHIQSIERMSEPTPVPLMPSYVRGLITVRGQIVPMIDLGEYIEKKRAAETEQTRLVVISLEERLIALIVDEAKEILDISDEDIRPFNGFSAADKRVYSGVASIGDRLISMLAIEKLMKEFLDIEMDLEQVEI